jgi:uncharacterized protein
MNISQNIEIIAESLWIKDKETLIIGDLHLGYEEGLQQKGILLPKQQLQETKNKIKNILQKVKPKTIIINGDLKHEFGKVLKQEWKEVTEIINYLSKHCQELILIKGNHDVILSPIADKNKLTIKEDYQIDQILITHGDKIKETKAKIIIIGHEHPSISLREKSKVERYKCFLKGKWKTKQLIVMPSFNPLLEGIDILKEKLLSPYLKKISNFEVIIISGEESLNFGKVKELIQE